MAHNFPELLHQASRIKDHYDQIRSSLFQIHNISTEYFSCLDIESVREMMRILDTDLKEKIIETLSDINHPLYQ